MELTYVRRDLTQLIINSQLHCFPYIYAQLQTIPEVLAPNDEPAKGRGTGTVHIEKRGLHDLRVRGILGALFFLNHLTVISSMSHLKDDEVLRFSVILIDCIVIQATILDLHTTILRSQLRTILKL